MIGTEPYLLHPWLLFIVKVILTYWVWPLTTLKDIKNKGHQLGSAYEQELKKKLRSITEFNSEINDLSEKLVDKYNEREKEYQRSYSGIGNKISQLNASNAKVRSQLISERKSHSESQRELEAKYTA